MADQFSKLFAYTAQDLALHPQLSGKDHLKTLKSVDPSNLSGILDSLSITSEWKIPVRNLPRDKRQLVGITLSLLSTKSHLIFDEPTKYLNEGDRARLLEVLQQIATTRSVLVATHEPSWSSLGNGSIHLQDGKVVQVEGQNLSDKFGWTYTGEILKPTTLNALGYHPNISIYQDLKSFYEAFANARGKYLLFDPEAQSFDQVTPVELFSFHHIESPDSLGPRSHQRIGTLSGGERGWIYLHFLILQKTEQLFLLYPSLNLDRTNHEQLQRLIIGLAETGTTISIFDGN
jgi:ABC-type cobalamin/Fe3+-siderophores transport system ATPase subunit